MDHKYLEELIKNIQSLVKCPSCGSPYKAAMISIIGGSGQTFLVHLECSLCGLPTLATVMFRQQKGNLMGSQEEYKFDFNSMPIKDNKVLTDKQNEIVDTDDVINMHQFLKDFSGDFESILSK